uniref:Uncharacterized protein n=1 Tax=virus sp. ctJLD79 TaxID=2827987 RepID=A0A8S5RFF9_9VIRU|nr:MAG TPA: hypothetical protein [virus sp. ctJLD79]
MCDTQGKGDGLLAVPLFAFSSVLLCVTRFSFFQSTSHSVSTYIPFIRGMA